jgi:hypothetical protein
MGCFDSETGFFFAISDLPAVNRIHLRANQCLRTREDDVSDVLNRKRGSSLRSVTYMLQIESVCVNPCKSVFANARTRCPRCLTQKRGSSLRSVTYKLQIESICDKPCKSVFAYARTRCQRCFDSETGFFFAISDLPTVNRIHLRQSVQISVCVCENMMSAMFGSETDFLCDQ